MKKSVLLTLIICAMIVVCSIVMFACDNEEPEAEVEIWKAQFEDAEGNIIYETRVEDGGTAVFEGDLPTKTATAKYTYSFTGWSPTLSNIHKDIVFKPLFKATQNQVLVTYLNDDDTPITTELVGYGDAAKYSGGAYKQSTVDKNFVFVGWDKSLTEVTEPITAKATYIAVDRYYVVNFKNYDGSILATKQVKYNTAVGDYTGEVPTKNPDGHYKYTFESWDRSLDDAIVGDTTITATYSHVDNLDYLTFTLSNDRTYYSATLKSGATTYEDCYIPGTYDDLPVKVIGGFVTYSSRIKNYYLGEGIETISSSAFSSGLMTTFTCPSTLKTIGQYAFSSCKSLSTFVFNEGLETIVANAFQNCSALKTVQLPSSLTSIGTQAFKESGVESINVSNNVTSLAQYAFQDMKYLKTATINADITMVPVGLFSGCIRLEELNLSDNITYLTQYFISNCSSLKTLVLPSNLETIGLNAFQNASVEVVDIPDGTTTIAQQAFYQSKVKEIIIPNSVTSVGQNAFSSSEYLERVVYNPNYNYVSGYAFSGDVRLKEVEIGEDVTIIGDYSFSGCTSLKNIVIPDNITQINQYAFKNCSNLFDVVLSANLTEIRAYAFKESTKAWFYFKAASLDGITLYSNWAGSDFQYVYSETPAEGAWHYKDDGSLEVWQV